MGIHPQAQEPLGQNLGHRYHQQLRPECARPGMSATFFFPIQLEGCRKRITDHGITLMIRSRVIDLGGPLLFIFQREGDTHRWLTTGRCKEQVTAAGVTRTGKVEALKVRPMGIVGRV
jgi:hypothetical protein